MVGIPIQKKQIIKIIAAPLPRATKSPPMSPIGLNFYLYPAVDLKVYRLML